MSQIVTEQFTKSIYAHPEGTRKTKPTIWDELRHAQEHSQKPLEQVLQLIGEFHGGFTGMNQATGNLLNFLLSLFSNKNNKNIQAQAQTALNALKNVVPSSSIGRINNITANEMPPEQLREFVVRSQQIHPSVNAYIQNNIGKYPYFQQISEQVGSLGQVVLTPTDIHPIKRIETGGKDSMTTNFPIRRNVEHKVFKNLSTYIDATGSIVNCLFLRSLRAEGNNSILLNGDNTKLSHGYNFTMDVENASRNNAAIAPSMAKTVQRFGPSLGLLNSFFPLRHQVSNSPEFFEIETETGKVMVDMLARPVTRTVKTPVAKDEDVVETD
jgi:hypothetical protein